MDKLCHKCGQTKPISEFYKIRGRETSPCKVCWSSRVRNHSAANRDAHVASVRVWREKNPEHARWLDRNQRAIMKARKANVAVIDLTWNDWQSLLSEYNHQCAYCGCPAEGSRRSNVVGLEMDHKVPFSLGGQHTKSNIAPCCVTCNREKRDRTPSQWKAHKS